MSLEGVGAAAIQDVKMLRQQFRQEVDTRQLVGPAEEDRVKEE